MLNSTSIPPPLSHINDCRPVTILVLGARAVGKTALGTRVCGGAFVSHYQPTTSPLLCRIPLVVDACTWEVRVIDVGGLDGSVGISLAHTLGVDAYILTFSLLSKRSLWFAQRINARLLEALAEPLTQPDTPRVLVGTHADADIDKKQVDSELANATAEQLHAPFFETSALTGEGCTSAFIAAIRLVRDGVTHTNIITKQEEKQQHPSSPSSQTDSNLNQSGNSSWAGCVVS